MFSIPCNDVEFSVFYGVFSLFYSVQSVPGKRKGASLLRKGIGAFDFFLLSRPNLGVQDEIVIREQFQGQLVENFFLVFPVEEELFQAVFAKIRASDFRDIRLLRPTREKGKSGKESEKNQGDKPFVFITVSFHSKQYVKTVLSLCGREFFILLGG